eukprot:351639-Chlamydomonas_euryale.AAC.4
MPHCHAALAGGAYCFLGRDGQFGRCDSSALHGAHTCVMHEGQSTLRHEAVPTAVAPAGAGPRWEPACVRPAPLEAGCLRVSTPHGSHCCVARESLPACCCC